MAGQLRVDAQDQRCRALIALHQRTGDPRCLHLLWAELRGYMVRCDQRMAARGMGIADWTPDSGSTRRGTEEGALFLVLVGAAQKFDLTRPAWFRTYLALEHRTACSNQWKVGRGRWNLDRQHAREAMANHGEAVRASAGRFAALTDAEALLGAISAKNTPAEAQTDA